MNLTPQQLTTLRNAINADPVMGPLAAQSNHDDGDVAIAAILNVTVSPDFFAWRSNVSRSDVYNSSPVPEASSWDWTKYKNQSATEQNAWTQIFMGDQADFSKANVRAGIAAIFTGAASSQVTHCLAVGRRRTTLAEKVLSTGAGSTASPATMGAEGTITTDNVRDARSA